MYGALRDTYSTSRVCLLTAQLYLMFLLITQHEVPFINTSEAAKTSSAQTENGNFQRSRTVEVVKAIQPHFTLSLSRLTSLKASERRGLLEDTGLEDKCSWVLCAAGEIA